MMISGFGEFPRRIFTDTALPDKIEVMIIIFRRRTPASSGEENRTGIG